MLISSLSSDNNVKKEDESGDNSDSSYLVAGNIEISNLLEDFYKLFERYDYIGEVIRQK